MLDSAYYKRTTHNMEYILEGYLYIINLIIFITIKCLSRNLFTVREVTYAEEIVVNIYELLFSSQLRREKILPWKFLLRLVIGGFCEIYKGSHFHDRKLDHFHDRNSTRWIVLSEAWLWKRDWVRSHFLVLFYWSSIRASPYNKVDVPGRVERACISLWSGSIALWSGSISSCREVPCAVKQRTWLGENLCKTYLCT